MSCDFFRNRLIEGSWESRPVVFICNTYKIHPGQRVSVGSLFVSIWVVVYIDCGFKAFLFSFRDIVFYGEMVYIGRGVRRWDGLFGSDLAWSALHGGPGVGSGEFQR